MKKILKVTVFFAFLGLLVFSFVTCKHSSGSSGYNPDSENENYSDPTPGDGLGTGGDQGGGGDGSGEGEESPSQNPDGGGSGSETPDTGDPGDGSGGGGDDQEGGSGNVEERSPLSRSEVEKLLSSYKSSPAIYKQIWNKTESNWGEFKFYKENDNYVYEFDNWDGNGDQEKGEVKINDDVSVTVTAKYWWNNGQWSDAQAESGISDKHRLYYHKYCGFILQFYDDDSAEVYEWLVKEGYDSYIPDSFPTESYVNPDGVSDYKNANVVYDYLTPNEDYYLKQE